MLLPESLQPVLLLLQLAPCVVQLRFEKPVRRARLGPSVAGVLLDEPGPDSLRHASRDLGIGIGEPHVERRRLRQLAPARARYFQIHLDVVAHLANHVLKRLLASLLGVEVEALDELL